MRSPGSVLSLLLLLTVAGPARAGFKCPDRGGPAWREIRTAHFVVQTDLASADGQALAREVERLYASVRYGLFKSPPESPGTIRVVALRSEEEFDLFAPKKTGAFYRRQTSAGPTIVMPGALQEAQRIVLAHELTHHVAARVYARQPWWFSEGLAAYMETVGSSGPDNTPTVGGVPQYRYRLVMPYRGGIGPVLAGAPAEQEQERGYSLAWALVHFLFNRKPAEFGQLQVRFGRGQDPVVAWREVFPAWDPATPDGTAALDEELGRYLASMRFRFRDVHLPSEEPVTERPLTAADAHAIRLSLRPWQNRGEPLPPEAVNAEVEEALGHDPGQVMALSVRADLDLNQALPLARKAVAAHPEDGRAWMLLALHLPGEDVAGRMEAADRAVRLDPQNAPARFFYAVLLLTAGRAEEAFPFARDAATLEPWQPLYLGTLAEALERVGQCPSALSIQHRAVDMLGEGWSSEDRRFYEKRLASLEARCGAGRASPTPAGTTQPGR